MATETTVLEIPAADAAFRLRTTPDSVRRWITGHKLKGRITADRRYLADAADVERLAASLEQTDTAA